MYLNNPSLLLFKSLTKFHSTPVLAFQISSLHIQTASQYSFQSAHLCFCYLYFFLFSLSLTSRSLLSHVGFQPPLVDFVYRGMESFCTLRKATLKCCQLCSVPLFLRTVFQGFLSNNSLNSPKFGLLKFRILTLLFTRSTSFEMTKSSRAWSVQLRQPPSITILRRSALHW